MKKSRMLASALCAVLMVGVLTVPAYAGGGDESEGSEYVPWVGLEPVDPLPVEQRDSQPFTPDGTGTVLDNATDQDGKEFFTITTADEAVFYLVIDRQRGAENVYFLNAVTVSDLMALAEPGQEPEAPPPVQEPEQPTEPVPDQEPEPQKTGGAGMLLAALAVLALGGGAGWYFKIYRPKQQKAAEPEENYSSYDEPEEYDDEPPWDVDDEDEGGDE
ncbi:CD1107 family mobile element protein [[Clostridium] symbiosum]|uniref:CD1107 family mobile element protein n=1 Tax=Clostridium symbiosum TaxID=1512 RepID=UPI0025A31BAF|nr:DUF4366 domain-containing protein [[Clostridium] symbiosum]MDM8136466.1 DUF4366 domain-containing protein [[Clostridium] symbiosum]MDM8140555.1 DUF4366 domain-containing protein [[Clostridium] symbiosum]MDM8320563.1 DUF4366 domain-containing protein [[Clostridium] symbiosum]